MIDLGMRYATRERTRFALTAGGLALAVVLTVFLREVYNDGVAGALSYVEEADADIWVGSKGSWNLMRTSGVLRESVGRRILAVDGVVSAEPMLAALVSAEIRGMQRTLFVIGIDRYAPAAGPKHVIDGTAIPRGDGIIVDRAFARRLNLGVGDSITIAGHHATVVGVSTHTNMMVTQYAFAARDELLRRVGVRERATFFLVKTDGTPVAVVQRRIEDTVSNVATYDRATFVANNRREIEVGLLPLMRTVSVLGLVVGVTFVALMTFTAVLEKRQDFAVLAALGASRRTRAGVVLQQAVTAAGAGALIGIGILLVLQRILPQLVPEVEFSIDAGTAVLAFGGAIVMAIVGAVIPAHLAMRLTPMEAFRQ